MLKYPIILFVGLLVTACAGPPSTQALPSPTPIPIPSASATLPPAPVADVCHVGAVVYCALNPAVTDANVGSTICNPAWTHDLRPPLSMTNGWKRAILMAYHLPGTISNYEGDHRVPEAGLGGDPGATWSGHGDIADARNWTLTTQTFTLPTGVLVPANFADESPKSPNSKDTDELEKYEQVCHRKLPFLTLTQARQQLIDKWLGPYPTFK